jgi:ribosomal protein S12 methylthiotransferase accessory factor
MIAAQPFRRLADVVDLLVDERVGVLKLVAEQPRNAGEPDFFRFVAQACNTAAFCGQKNFHVSGGASAERERAVAKAVGEAVERYCAAIYEAEELPLSSAASASFPCVPPESFALYRPEQHAEPGFPWRPFTAETPVRWTPARDLATGEAVHVPAAMVFIPYAFRREVEEPFVQPISTGLACHCSCEEAAVAALCEVVERDAFLITWQARLAMPQIPADSLSAENRDLVERFRRVGDAVTLLDLRLDTGIPTILSVRRGGRPGVTPLSFAAATDLDPESAVRKSLEELAHTARYMQAIDGGLDPLEAVPGHPNVVNQENHLQFWCNPAHASRADFVFAAEERVLFAEIPSLAAQEPRRDLRTLVERIQAVGHRALLAEVTTPDVAELGLAVVRALVPGFHPLFMGYRNRALGGSRLWEVPRTLGRPGITPETGDNPDPHPYP